MKEMTEEEYHKLDDLRKFMVHRRITEIQNILTKYYPKGTKIIIDKDNYTIE